MCNTQFIRITFYAYSGFIIDVNSRKNLWDISNVGKRIFALCFKELIDQIRNKLQEKNNCYENIKFQY
jgi:hypothetical protein